jgi:hypothetical protein
MSSFFVVPAGTETDQSTRPPDAVSVIEAVPGDVMSSVAGLTVSVPAVSAGDSEAEADAETLGAVSPGLELGLGLAPLGVAPAPIVAAALTVGVPVARGRCVAGAVRPVLAGLVPVATTAAPPPGWCPAGWWCGTTARVTPATAATAAAAAVVVPAAVLMCIDPTCHQGVCSGWTG